MIFRKRISKTKRIKDLRERLDRAGQYRQKLETEIVMLKREINATR